MTEIKTVHKQRRGKPIVQKTRCLSCGTPLFMSPGGNFPVCREHPDAQQVEETTELYESLFYLDKLRVLDDGSFFLAATNRRRTPTREQAEAWVKAGQPPTCEHDAWRFPVGEIMVSHPGLTPDVFLQQAIPLWERWGRVALPERVIPEVDVKPESRLLL